MKSVSKIVLLSLCILSSSFAGEILSLGARASGNYNMLWGDNAPKDGRGWGYNAGGGLLLKVAPMLFINPEVTFAFRENTNSDTTDLLITEFELDKTQTFLNLDIPVLVRIQPANALYLEAGPQLSVNLKATYLTKGKVEGVSAEKKGDIKDANLLEFGLVAGIGSRIAIGNGLDVGFRFMMGLTDITEEDKDSDKKTGNFMGFHLGATYWIL